MHAMDTEGFQLSLQQRSLWSRSSERRLYRTQAAVLVEGELDPNRLRDALGLVFGRQEILRTTFRRVRGVSVPLQFISEGGAPPLSEVDLSASPAREQAVAQLFEQEGRRPFDFERERPVRLTLARLSASEHVLLISASALCCDARTVGNLVAELGRRYAARTPGAEASDEPLQYADYCQWQSEMIEGAGEEAARGRAFWQAQNPTAPLPRLPWERGARADALVAPQSFSLTFAAGVAPRVEAVAARLSATPAAFLQACWQALLWRLTGDGSVPVSAVLDGRGHEDLRDAFGLFAMPLPLRSEFEEGLSFSTVVEQTEWQRREAEELLLYFPEGSSAGAAGRDADAPVGFEYAELPPPYSADGVSLSVAKQYSYTQGCRVKLSCVRAGQSLSAEFHYDPSLYGREDVERLARCYEAVLTSALENPDARAGDLRVLGHRDRDRLLFEVNDTAAAFEEEGKCVHQLFEEQAARNPERAAVVSEERQLTYSELNAEANRLAHLLREFGVGPETAVGLCVERSAETVVGLLGVLKAGGAYVPLDHDSPAARLSRLAKETRLSVLLTQERFLERFADFDGRVICLDRDRPLIALRPDGNPPNLTTPDNLAYVIYTSGSTGQPKGAALSHRSLVNYVSFVVGHLLAASRQQASAPLHYAMVSTFAADLGHTCLFPSLASGGALHVLSYECATDASLLSAYQAERPLDVLKITPSHLKALLGAGGGSGLLPRRCLILGGEALTYDLVGRVRAAGGVCRVVNHYGPTEATVGALTWEVEECDGRSGAVPIGKPVANARAFVLDAEMRPVAEGLTGELYLGGVGLARGYLNNAAETARRFVPDSVSGEAGARLYRTGDLARRLAGGEVEYVGRSDHQVKVRGFRVELGEIETALKQHASVRDAVVLAEEDESGHRRLVACVVAAAKGTEAAAELRGFLKERLPEYMMPSAFVMLEGLPLTANGKVDRAALSSLARAQQAAAGDGDHDAPRDAAEASMAQIWAEVLGLERVGVHDNFFSLGGDSILGIQIIARANQAGFQLTPKLLLQHQTVAELVGVSGSAPGVEVQHGALKGDVPLTPIQRRFFEQELSAPQLYSQAVAYEVRPPLDAPLLKAVVGRLLAHHDALRLRFVREEAGWRQTYAPADEDAVFFYEDLSQLSRPEQKARVEAATAELQSGMDLSVGPLVRIALFHLGGQQPDRLLVICHYLVVDGFSWRVLLEDLQSAYQQLARGEEIRLPAKTTSFQSWSERMVRTAHSEETARALDYWLARPGEEVGRGLPLDYAAGANVESSVGTVSTWLSAEETAALLREVPAAYHTEITDALLTALAQAVTRWTGERTLCVELESHGRSDTLLGEDLSRTVGRVTYRSPAWIELSGEGGPGDALKSVKEQLRRFREVSVSYGLLRYASDDAATAERMRALPRPEIYFNYVGQLDQFLSSSALTIKAAPQLITAVARTDNRRPYLLDISAMILDGRLQCLWEYSRHLHERETVAALAESFNDALRALITHSQSPEAGGYTPSDFPSMGFDQEELDDLIAKLSAPANFNEQELN